MNVKKIIAICLASVLLISVLAGCNQETVSTSSNKISDKHISLKYWTVMPWESATMVTDLADTELYKELEKRTNIEMEFIHPTTNEQFNLMIASRDLPDLIEMDWSSYPGAEKKAAEDQILIELTDLVSQHAPNMINYLEKEVPQAKKWVTTEGKYYVFPSLSANDDYLALFGPVIRKDLLEKYNLEVPTTIDEWEHVLRTFKEGGIKYPLSFMDTDKTSYMKSLAQFIGAFGISRVFYLEDGNIKYGYLEERMKDYLTLMKRWIDEGLVDPDVTTMDGKAYEGKILNGEVGAFCDYVSSMKNRELDLQSYIPEAELVPAPYPSLEKGELCKIVPFDRIDGYTYANAVGITTANKHPEETVKWLDYAFSEEGHMLYNFGIEGVTYEMVDGYPKYTDLITNNPDGYAMNIILSKYARPNAVGYVDGRHLEQYYNTPLQRDALSLWSNNAKQVEPSIIWRACYKFTAEEAREYNDLLMQFENFTAEKYARYLTGVESLDTFDDYIEQLKSMGAERAIEIIQTAYNRAVNQE